VIRPAGATCALRRKLRAPYPGIGGREFHWQCRCSKPSSAKAPSRRCQCGGGCDRVSTRHSERVRCNSYKLFRRETRFAASAGNACRCLVPERRALALRGCRATP